MNQETCKKCGKDFTYKVTDMGVPGGKDREYIDCPYCGETNGSVVTSGFVYTFKIEENSTN
jgi:transposase-like protein